jgi:hypothetical protein
MSRRSPRLNISESVPAVPAPVSVPAVPVSVPAVPAPVSAPTAPTEVPVTAPTAAAPTYIVSIVCSGTDDTLTIAIRDDECVLTESYVNPLNQSQKQATTIPIYRLPTHLYTYLDAACIDEHSCWKSMQITCSFMPTMYIRRENLAVKREFIVQTLITHIMNLN